MRAVVQRVKRAHVSVADVVPYEQLIKAMDNCLTAGFSAISVATGGPN